MPPSLPPQAKKTADDKVIVKERIIPISRLFVIVFILRIIFITTELYTQNIPCAIENSVKIFYTFPRLTSVDTGTPADRRNEGLMKERRGGVCKASGATKGRPPKPDKKVEESLFAENQRLRTEIAYLNKSSD